MDEQAGLKGCRLFPVDASDLHKPSLESGQQERTSSTNRLRLSLHGHVPKAPEH